MKIPTAQIILNYELVYNENPPENRLSILEGVCVEHILYEIAGLNHRLKSKIQLDFDTTLDSQVRELKHFARVASTHNIFAKVAAKHTDFRYKNYPLIFNRPACLFAMEEIINSYELKKIPNYKLDAIGFDKILKYLVAVNSEILKIQNENNNNEEEFDLERFNPPLLPLNDLFVETDIFFTVHRGVKLIDYFLKNNRFGKDVQSYFNEVVRFNSDEYFYRIVNLYIHETSENDDNLNFHYQIQPEKNQWTIFDALSIRIKNKETHKLISLKKSPFIKINDEQFILSDNTFLIDKLYYQLINDIWFDKIRNIKENGKNKHNIKSYRGLFGSFLESYISEILTSAFSKYRYAKLLLFDELKVQTKLGEIEVSDIYLRYNTKIILGEVKSSNIYDKEKYGGDIDTLYRNDRNTFFKTFGLNQVVESIKNLQSLMLELDDKFPKGKTVTIYPIIIINDKIFKTPFIAQIFNLRFQELISTLDTKKYRILSLQLIHVNEIERLEEYLSNNPKEIWEILKVKKKQKGFVPPFEQVVDSVVKTRKPPVKIKNSWIEIATRFNKNPQ